MRDIANDELTRKSVIEHRAQRPPHFPQRGRLRSLAEHPSEQLVEVVFVQVTQPHLPKAGDNVAFQDEAVPVCSARLGPAAGDVEKPVTDPVADGLDGFSRLRRA